MIIQRLLALYVIIILMYVYFFKIDYKHFCIIYCHFIFDLLVHTFYCLKVLFSPGKASNAGGVATSGLEMSQNSLRYNWTREEVDQKLHNIMLDIHKQCVDFGKGEDGFIDYVKGANIAGFVKVADAMIDQGVV